MKIMLCGKGGCGKSTISTLLANEYAKSGKRVLVLDTDESNYGLHRQLGLPLPKDFTLFFGSKKGIFEKVAKNDPDPKPFKKQWTFDDIPEEYTSSRDSIRLMAIGKIHEAGEGCACPMGTLAKHFLLNLQAGENDIIITDSEAGVEHFGRGVDSAVDVILMVVDPSYESLQLSRKIGEMGKSIGKPVYYILNKVNTAKAAVMRSAVADPSSVLAVIPENEEVLFKGLMGEQLDTSLPEIQDILKVLN